MFDTSISPREVYVPAEFVADYKTYVDDDQADGLWYGFKVVNDTKYSVYVNNVLQTSTAIEGEEITITADAPATGMKFKNWTVDSGGITLTDDTLSTITFDMPASNVEVTANYENTNYTVTVNGGGIADEDDYIMGDVVTITTPAPGDGIRFTGWTVDSGDVTLVDSNALETTFTMGTANVEVTANYEKISYDVTVNNGTTSDDTYTIGDEVTITANDPTSGMRFKNWTVVSGGVTLVDDELSTTTFTMTASNVEVTANYEGFP